MGRILATYQAFLRSLFDNSESCQNLLVKDPKWKKLSSRAHLFADAVFCTDPTVGGDTKFDSPTRKNGADRVSTRLRVGAHVLHLRVFFVNVEQHATPISEE